jgi:predicted ribosome quality control (RQC) complex YloA/Tae2 family protein
MSEAVETYYASIESLSGHAALRAQVRAELEQLRAREERRLASLREELQRAGSLEELRRRGEYILAFMHTLTPGQRLLHIPEEHLTIELDPALTPVENAQALFREYRKARSALQGLPEKIAGVEMRVRFYDELLTSLELASTYDEIRAVQAESALALNRPTERESEQGKNRGKARAGRPTQKLPRPMRLQTRRGASILVGRTAGQSDAATFHLAAPDDLWFHVLGAPGAHVILRTAGGITQEDIREAAAIAAGYSKLRDEPQVDVVYTEKRHVRRVPGAPPGLVTYRNEQVIRVTPARPPTATPGQ